MVLEKLLIDGLTSPKSFLDAVPELDAGLAQFPAKINLFAVELSGEINEADIQILHQASIPVYFFECRLEGARERLAPALLLAHSSMIHQHASQHRDAMREALPVSLGLLILGFDRYRVPDRRLNFGKQLLGLLQREKPGHPIRVGQA
jgi:hypothetical protein